MAPRQSSVEKRWTAKGFEEALISGGEVDLHQCGGHGWTRRVDEVTRPIPTQLSMPPANKFKKFDVRPLLKKGVEPLPEIIKRVRGLKAEEVLIIVAPFLPSPLIERLGSEGYDSKLEPGQAGQWFVYFWRKEPTEDKLSQK